MKHFPRNFNNSKVTNTQSRKKVTGRGEVPVILHISK